MQVTEPLYDSCENQDLDDLGQECLSEVLQSSMHVNQQFQDTQLDFAGIQVSQEDQAMTDIPSDTFQGASDACSLQTPTQLSMQKSSSTTTSANDMEIISLVLSLRVFSWSSFQGRSADFHHTSVTLELALCSLLIYC